MFTDIADFSDVAETIPAEELASLLSEYLEALTLIIKRSAGTIDKYIGDAIMAFWGAPVPDSDQVVHACYAALFCKKRAAELNEIWAAQGKPKMLTRFGLNTGSTIVGNIGSSDRISYTVIGDSVNLAARLESINKNYGTQIIVSHEVYQAASHHFLFRPLDMVRVKGRQQTTLIYELVAGGEEDQALAPTARELELCQMTKDAFLAYRHKDIALAYTLYQKIQTSFPDDVVASIYIERCREELSQ